MTHVTRAHSGAARPEGRRRALPLVLLLVLLLVLPVLAIPGSAQEILPFSEIKPGMKGFGRTVFSGTTIEDFQVEVIGTLENIGPRRNLILVRLAGGPLEKTGVMSGMSGSPVYIGNRLAGAVSYTWGFAKEPLAGVTPIQEMLAIENKEGPALRARARAPLPPQAGPAGLRFLRDPRGLPAHFASYFAQILPLVGAGGWMSPGGLSGAGGSIGSAGPSGASGSMSAIGMPLVFSGFPAAVVDRLAPDLARAGLVAVRGSSSAKSSAKAAALIEPGAGVGIGLARGDVEISAICTVTYRDADRVLACGHPLLNLGPTDLIMTTASVVGLFPSLQSSFKFASVGEDVGVFRQDRSTGVMGYVGKKARLIPVRIELRPDRGGARRFAFDIAEDPFLAPYLLYAGLNAILSSEEKDFGDVTLTYEEGSTIQVAGEEDVTLANLFSGDLARLYASGTVAFITQLLLNSEYRPVHINGINLILRYSDERRTARLERAWVSKDTVRPGETIQVAVSLRPYRGPEIMRHIDLEIPREVSQGRLVLRVGDAVALARAEDSQHEDFVPRDLKQLIWLINHLRSSDKVYAVLTQNDNGILYQGVRLPNLPPSVARVMVRPQTRGNYMRLRYRAVAEESISTRYALEGYKLLTITVED